MLWRNIDYVFDMAYFEYSETSCTETCTICTLVINYSVNESCFLLWGSFISRLCHWFVFCLIICSNFWSFAIGLGKDILVHEIYNLVFHTWIFGFLIRSKSWVYLSSFSCKKIYWLVMALTLESRVTICQAHLNLLYWQPDPP